MNRSNGSERSWRPLGRWTLTDLSVTLLCGALAWRTLRYLLGFPVWGDEGMLAVNFFDRGFLDLLNALDHGQIAPAGFLWLELAVSKVAGLSGRALRLVPFIGGVAGAVLFWRMAGRLLDRRSALMAMAIFAASFYPTRYAAEIKPYSIDFLAAVLITMAAWRVWQKPERTLRWTSLGMIGAIAVWFSYPSVLVSGGAFLFLLGSVVRRRSERLLPLLAGSILLVTSFAAMYAIVGAGQSARAPVSYWNGSFPPVSRPWLLPVWALDMHTGMMFAYPNGGHSGGSIVTFGLVVAGTSVLWRTRRSLLWLLLSPFPLMFVAAALHRYPYGGSARVAQHIAPAVCLLAGVGLVCVLRKVLGGRRTVRGLRIAVLPFLVVVVAGMVRDVARPYHSEADAMVRDVITELAEGSADGDQWIVYGSLDPGPWAPHFVRFVGMGGRLRYQVRYRVPGPLAWAPAPDEAVRAASGRTWVIAYGNRVYEHPRDVFEQYLGALSEPVGTARLVRRHDLPAREWIEVYELR
jgi:hypothetical protein